MSAFINSQNASLVLVRLLALCCIAFILVRSSPLPGKTISTSQTIQDGLYLTTKERAVLQVLETFKTQHGIRAVEQRNSNRKYIVGTYSCPYQAGNRVFHFLNSFVHAIILNRTLLWQYCSDESNVCPFSGNVLSCDRLLKRSKWIPPFDNESEAELLYGRYARRPTAAQIFGPRVDFFVDQVPSLVVDAGVIEWPILERFASPEIDVLSPPAKKIATTLFGAGTYFAYGALFNAAFQLDQSLLPLEAERRSNISIAIHSRHQNPQDAGGETGMDESCLEKAHDMVRNLSAPDTHCSVVILSDRQRTIDALRSKAVELGCSPMIASHRTGHSFSNEHGIFAGVGFWQDLALAQQATSNAVVKTDGSTASELMTCLIRYRRTKMQNRHDLIVCVHDKIGTCRCHFNGVKNWGTTNTPAF